MQESKSIAKRLAAQKAQHERNVKRRLSNAEEQVLVRHRCDYHDAFKDDRVQIQKRLANLGYLFELGPTCYGITDAGIDYLHDHNIILRSK